jgi:hypothetical protein
MKRANIAFPDTSGDTAVPVVFCLGTAQGCLSPSICVAATEPQPIAVRCSDTFGDTAMQGDHSGEGIILGTQHLLRGHSRPHCFLSRDTSGLLESQYLRSSN